MNMFKVGGIWFARIGRSQVSFCRVGRERHASYRMRHPHRISAEALLDFAVGVILIAAGALGAAGYIYAHLGASAAALGMN